MREGASGWGKNGGRTITGAVVAAVAVDLRVLEAAADLLGRAPEVVDGALGVGLDLAGRDEDVVDGDALAAVREVEGVVHHRVGLGVGEPVHVPVGVAGQHDGRLLGRGDGDDLGVPRHLAHRVRDVRDDLAGEPFLAVRVHDGEGDAVLGVGHDGEVTPIPTVDTPVQGVEAGGVLGGLVLVGGDVVINTINFEGAVLDAVGIPTGNAAKMGVALIQSVLQSSVETHDKVAIDPVFVLDQKIRDRGAVGDEGSRNAFAVDPVFAIWVDMTGARRRTGNRTRNHTRNTARNTASQNAGENGANQSCEQQPGGAQEQPQREHVVGRLKI